LTSPRRFAVHQKDRSSLNNALKFTRVSQFDSELSIYSDKRLNVVPHRARNCQARRAWMAQWSVLVVSRGERSIVNESTVAVRLSLDLSTFSSSLVVPRRHRLHKASKRFDSGITTVIVPQLACSMDTLIAEITDRSAATAWSPIASCPDLVVVASKVCLILIESIRCRSDR
jgi:hypothetical protein